MFFHNKMQLPVKRVVKVWKYSHQKCRIGTLKVVPDSIQNCKPNVETVCDVEANQDLVETILHLRPKILEDM